MASIDPSLELELDPEAGEHSAEGFLHRYRTFTRLTDMHDKGNI